MPALATAYRGQKSTTATAAALSRARPTLHTLPRPHASQTVEMVSRIILLLPLLLLHVAMGAAELIRWDESLGADTEKRGKQSCGEQS